MRRPKDAAGANRLYIMGTPYALVGAGEWKKAYIFQYTNDGYISVIKTVKGVETVLLDWTRYDGIKAYDFNVLKVSASGGVMKFYMNGEKVWEGTDTQLTSGRIGVGMVKSVGGWTPLFVTWAKFYPNIYSVTSVEPMAALGATVSDWSNYSVSPEYPD